MKRIYAILIALTVMIISVSTCEAQNVVAVVIDVRDDTVYIDKGGDDGVQKGWIFNVVRDLTPVVANSSINTKKSVSVAKIEVYEISENFAICKVIANIGEIKNGDVANHIN